MMEKSHVVQWRRRFNLLSTWIIMVLITVGLGIAVVSLRLFYFFNRIRSQVAWNLIQPPNA